MADDPLWECQSGYGVAELIEDDSNLKLEVFSNELSIVELSPDEALQLIAALATWVSQRGGDKDGDPTF